MYYGTWWQKAVLLAILNSSGEFGSFSHTFVFFFFVFVFVVMDSCQVRIGLPCDDNSINTNIISAKNVKIFADCDVANIWMEWMIMS